MNTPPEYLKQKIISVMFADRLLQTVALSLLALIFLCFSQEQIEHRYQLILFSAVASLVFLTILFQGQHALRFFGFILKNLPSKFSKQISIRLAEIEGFCPKTLLICLGLSLLYQLSVIILVDKMLLTGLGLQLPILPFMGIALIIRFVRMIPVTLSGIGVREGLYPYFLASFGIAHESAFLLGLVGSFLVIGAGLLGGLLELLENFKTKKALS